MKSYECEKKKYESKSHAEKVLWHTRIFGKDNARFTCIRSYYCAKCDAYHLTSKKKNELYKT